MLKCWVLTAPVMPPTDVQPAALEALSALGGTAVRSPAMQAVVRRV